MKVLLDTTVLASAILTPIGLGSKIIKLARAETFLFLLYQKLLLQNLLRFVEEGLRTEVLLKMKLMNSLRG